MPIEGPRAPPPEALPLSVLHQDDAVVFVDKPAGIPVHPLKAGELGTVANRLVARFPEVVDASEDPREAGLTHRLDIETSGVLLVARTRDAWSKVRAQFSAGGTAKKLYLALVNGPIADDGEIDVPLVQHGDHVRPALSTDEAARPALSTFRVLQRWGMDALVEVQIHTGVMHQVRAHLAAIGAPIVGDALYRGPPLPRRGEGRGEGKERHFLPAASLEIVHPTSGHPLKVESPLPAELQQVLSVLG